MKIVSAKYTDWGGIEVVFEGQAPTTQILVPPDANNKDYQMLVEWEAAGNTITPYEPPDNGGLEP